MVFKYSYKHTSTMQSALFLNKLHYLLLKVTENHMLIILIIQTVFNMC